MLKHFTSAHFSQLLAALLLLLLRRQTDVQRLMELAQDPRPVEEKSTVLRQAC